ncbi:Pentatricopeptide repeat-containing protein [Platanthera zijinensis]|uniref:Pentatricopeptide repeat-containing protein n=1 Tax=Platanthera zijinensis TaxID=2320716 RepID=A0AAP0G2N4_9ASPA
MSHRFLLRSLQNFCRRRLHTSARKLEPPVATAIQAFCREGEIRQAISLFDEMPDKNVFSFSAMIHGYASNGFHLESLHLFCQMQRFEIRPNTFTFVAVLLASTGLKNLMLAECIHGSTTKTGIETDSFVRTALLNSYSKCGAAAEAYRLFRETYRPALASWNAIIAGFAHNERFEESFLLFERLRREGITPNCITMVIVTQICTDRCSLEACESIHGYVVKIGLESDVALMNSVLDMYSSFRNSEIAGIFFMKMTTRDAITWTNMMSFMLELENPTEALHFFSQMTACGINGDTVTMVNIISACALLGDLGKGKAVHGRILALGFGSELPVSNALITMYSRCGCLWVAWMLFNQIADKSLVSWTAMMFGYAYNEKHKDGIELFIRMRREEPLLDLDSVTLICSLVSSGELASLLLCKQLHGHSFKSGLNRSILVQNSLVAAYGRCGEPDLAVGVFKEMIQKDIISWNAMISSHGINGEGEEALLLFHEMDRCGEEPDSITFVNVLSACSHSGMVDEGLLVFEKMMKEKRIRPRGEHYGCLADMLSRAGRLDDGKKFADSMPEEFAPGVWRALLAGCRINVDSGIAEAAGQRVFEICPGDAGHVALLSNVYASVGRFDRAEGLRAGIGSEGLVKKVGFSMVHGLPSGSVELD